MDFCYVWLRKLTGQTSGIFAGHSTRTGSELTVNQTEGRGIYHFTEGLSQVFRNFAKALKPGRPFAFTYHHSDPEAYLPLVVALSDARLVCTLRFPARQRWGLPFTSMGRSPRWNPRVVIEAKISEDDGTARDKVTRIQHLAELSARRAASGQPPFEVLACIDGRGFGVRREDMRKLLGATQGKVFTLKTLDHLVGATGLNQYRTR